MFSIHFSVFFLLVLVTFSSILVVLNLKSWLFDRAFYAGGGGGGGGV